MTQRLQAAMAARDAWAMAELFADDYRSVQPIHPARGFGGRDQVLKNWTSVFAGVPDFVAELKSWARSGEIEWAEWDWHGHHTDGSNFAMRGVVVLIEEHGRIGSARLYMEPVDLSGQDIDAAVQDLYRAPEAPST